MSRCPFQVLVIPFIRTEQKTIKYCIFKRADELYWQFIAGGGKDLESPWQAAIRETFKESGISDAAQYFKLDTVSSISVSCFAERDLWRENRYVIPNYCFAVEVSNQNIVLSEEHLEYCWVNYQEAKSLLYWDDNKTALWELKERLLNNDWF